MVRSVLALALIAIPMPAYTVEPAALPTAPAAAAAAAAEPAPVAAEPGFAIEAAQLTSAVVDKQPVDTKTTFATGERGFLWLKLKPAREGATLRLRWSLNGAAVWTMEPAVVKLGRTWYYKTLDQPGEWKVEVLDDGDTVLHTASVAVAGAPIAAAAPGAPAVPAVPAATPAPAAAPSVPAVAPEPAAQGTPAAARLEVVELQLAKDIDPKTREPLDSGTVFSVGAKVYAFVKLAVNEPETSVRFRWYSGDALVYTSQPQSLRQSPAWRTWAYKTADRAGAWRVEVIDADDKPVQELAFSVQ